MDNQHYLYLQLALKEAEKGRGLCAPNPAVGAVIVKNNQIIATGFHQGSGTRHAEIVALDVIGNEAEGATLYVTLEPCCHFGKTPPCVDRIIQSGIKKVYFGYQDPNPIVYGQGQRKLLEANIICKKLFLPEIDLFYQSYDYWINTKLPFVTAKLALSLDGKIAGKNGERVQITGEELQKFTHLKRLRSDAILTTAKTIQIDNPQMNVRVDNQVISKPIYILDRTLKISDDKLIFQTAKKIVLFHEQNVATKRLDELESKNIECREIPVHDNKLDLQAVLQSIGKDGCHELWVEAGGHCFEAFLNKHLLQQAFIYIAPKILQADATATFSLASAQLTHAKETKFYPFKNEIAIEFNF